VTLRLSSAAGRRLRKGILIALAVILGLAAWQYVATNVLPNRFDAEGTLRSDEDVLSLDYRVVQSTPAAWAKVSTLSYNSTTGQAIYREALVTNPETLDYKRQVEITLTKSDFSAIYSALREGLEKGRITTKSPKGSLELFIQVRFRDDSALTIYGQGGLIVVTSGTSQFVLEPASALDGFVKVVSDLASLPA